MVASATGAGAEIVGAAAGACVGCSADPQATATIKTSANTNGRRALISQTA